MPLECCSKTPRRTTCPLYADCMSREFHSRLFYESNSTSNNAPNSPALSIKNRDSSKFDSPDLFLRSERTRLLPHRTIGQSTTRLHSPIHHRPGSFCPSSG